jgi:hypothetical protein
MCTEALTTHAGELVGIGEDIDRSMQLDPEADGRIVQRKITTLHRIGHEIAGDHQRIIAAEHQVPEEIHTAKVVQGQPPIGRPRLPLM